MHKKNNTAARNPILNIKLVVFYIIVKSVLLYDTAGYIERTYAITGLLTVLLEGESGNAYNIASKLCITTIAGIAHTLVESYPEKGLKVIFDLPTEAEAKGFSLIENAVLSSDKLEALGWEPETDLVTGLKNVVEEQIELKV